MKQQLITTAFMATLGASAVSAATIVQTVGNVDWNDAMWGGPAAAPTGGNDYVSATGVTNNRFRIGASGASSTFGGDSITVVAGTTALSKLANGSTGTITGTFTLDGGRLTHGANSTSSATLATGGFIVTSTVGSTIGAPTSSNVFTITGDLSGSGDLLMEYESGSDAGTRSISFGSVGAYSGTISLTEGLTLDFGSSVNFGGGLTIDAISDLNVDQTLTFNSGALTANGVVIADGTYTGAALDGLGSNFINDGGTLIITAVPEPSSAALLGLGGFALIFRRRK